MAISQRTCVSFLNELYSGTHDISNDTLKCALYGSTANLDVDTTAYTTSGEITGSGYSAGGKTLSLASGYPKVTSPDADLDFDDLVWTSSTLTGVMGALIYNSSQSNKAISVISFGAGVSSSNGSFTLTFPDPNVEPALRLVAG